MADRRTQSSKDSESSSTEDKAKAEPKKDDGAQAEAPKAAEPQADPAVGDLKFPVAQLISDAADLLGYEPYEAAGGLHGVEGELTISDAKARVAAWLESPVKEA